MHEVSGEDGIKFDLNLLLDADGDLYVINTEENHNSQNGQAGLGLVWYKIRCVREKWRVKLMERSNCSVPKMQTMRLLRFAPKADTLGRPTGHLIWFTGCSGLWIHGYGNLDCR